MRLLIGFALYVFAVPAVAQGSDAQTVNGVRVWKPATLKPAPWNDGFSEPAATGALGNRGFEVETVNGVRVWRPLPKPPFPLAILPPVPESQVVIEGPVREDAFGVPPAFDVPLYGAWPVHRLDRHRNVTHDKPHLRPLGPPVSVLMPKPPAMPRSLPFPTRR